MTDSLLVICANAFAAVLGLLAFLAGAMRLLLILFPERPHAPGGSFADPTLAAAIAAASARTFPGSRVTRIQEIP